jgi:nucleotide-binding universal stress UspA family protein
MTTETAPSGEFDNWASERASHSLTTVLVAVGGSDDPNSAVRLGAAIARDQGARVRVVHATERQIYGRGSFDLETPEEARQLVESALSEIRLEGVEASGHVVHTIVGHVPDAILHEAAEVNADEIIVGAKRDRGLFHRGTAERLLRHSWLPVVVAPRPGTRRSSSSRRAQSA